MIFLREDWQWLPCRSLRFRYPIGGECRKNRECGVDRRNS